MEGKKVLVTGASGFIGSFLVEGGLERGMQTWAGIRKTSSKKYLQDNHIQFAELNLDDKLKLKDLDKTLHYRFTSVGARLRVGQFGNLVKHVVPVNLNPHGVILRTADRHITLPDGHQELTLSGAALQQGIPLLPLFRGTGYDKNQRTHGDFGSDIYIVKEIEE